MRTLALGIFALYTTLSLAPLGGASGDCDSKGTVALGIVEIPTLWGAFYVDDRGYVFGNGVWTYAESNGIYGGGGPTNPSIDLQRGGSAHFSWDNEICVDDPTIVPDELLF